jgi:hypothetical protein
LLKQETLFSVIVLLNEKFDTKDTNGENQKLAITFKGIDYNGKIVFELKEDVSKFDGTVNLLKTILEQNHFARKNILL